MTTYDNVKRTLVVKEQVKDDSPPSISIDNTIRDCLICVKRIVTKITEDTAGGRMPPRETVQTLKDCLTMLMEAKKKEHEILDTLSETDLQKMLQD